MKAIKFGTDGWRGVVSFDFTLPRVLLVAEAIRQYLLTKNLLNRPLIIANDTRFLAPEISALVGNYLLDRGLDVKMIRGFTPTPVTAFAVLSNSACGAIMLTASHNPYYYLGVKFIPYYGGPAEDEITEQISNAILELSQAPFGVPEFSPVFKGDFIDVKEAYFNHVSTLVNGSAIKSLHARMLYSPMYGCGQGFVTGFLKRYDVEVHRMHVGRDVLFGGILPDPNPSNLKLLVPKLKELGLELGFATDGDADRFGIVTKDGDCFGANHILPLLAEFLISIKQKKGALVRTVVTSHLLDEVGKHFNVPVVETPVGFKYVGKHLREGALIGGEESGGISIQGHVPEKDGILSILLTLEMIATYGESLPAIYKKLTSRFVPYSYERIDLNLKSNQRKEVMVKARRFIETGSFLGERIEEVKTIDGLKVTFEDGSWVAFRESGTEEVLRVYFEAPTEQSFKRLKKQLRYFLQKC